MFRKWNDSFAADSNYKYFLDMLADSSKQVNHRCHHHCHCYQHHHQSSLQFSQNQDHANGKSKVKQNCLIFTENC